jgi:branched-subunit amino acid aminotransferase/4-amino-4-deoxychorismate lyase
MWAAQNGTAWAGGGIRKWADVSVPLMSDAVLRAAAVFDGIRADVGKDGSIRLLSGEAHARHLLTSAKVLEISVDYQSAEILEAAALVARAELSATGKEVAYVRPMALASSVTAGAGEWTTHLPQPRRPVAEAVGAALLVERDRVVMTPPVWDGVLPLITVDVIKRIAAATGVAA